MKDKVIKAVDRFCDILSETLDSGKGKFKNLKISEAHELLYLVGFVGDFAAGLSTPGFEKRNRAKIIKKYQNLSNDLKDVLPKVIFNYIQNI